MEKCYCHFLVSTGCLLTTFFTFSYPFSEKNGKNHWHFTKLASFMPFTNTYKCFIVQYVLVYTNSFQFDCENKQFWMCRSRSNLFLESTSTKRWGQSILLKETKEAFNGVWAHATLQVSIALHTAFKFSFE